ncbi:MAG: apolipoprotein N-acyltransferase [Hyphomicrobiales bacterium]
MAAEPLAIGNNSRIAWWSRFAACGALGAVSALALPPWNHWWLLLLTVSAFASVLDRIAPVKRRPSGFAAGWAFGFGYFCVSLWWIGQAFLVDPDSFEWLMPFALAGLPAVLAVYWGLAAAAAVAFTPEGPARAYGFALALSVAEWLRGHLLTGFPWNTPGYAIAALPGMPQAAAVVGIYGLTLLVLVWTVTPAVLVDALRRRSLAAAIVPLAILASAVAVEAAGRARLAGATDETVPGVRLRLVQPSIPQSLKWDAEEARRIYDILLAQTRGDGAGAGSDPVTVVVWPESAVPYLIEEAPQALTMLADATPPGARLLIGALRRPAEVDPATGQRPVFNSILAFGPGAQLLGRYDKWHLVPFGEYLPFERWLTPLGLRRMVRLPGGLSPGPGPKIMRVQGLPPFVPLVCYEAIFPEAAQPSGERAGFLLNVTNDAWFGDSAGPRQHFEQARFRAIEQGMPLIRAANNGISGVVDGYGRVQAETTLNARITMDIPLPIVLLSTTFARYNQLPYLLTMVGLVVVVVGYSRRKG